MYIVLVFLLAGCVRSVPVEFKGTPTIIATLSSSSESSTSPQVSPGTTAANSLPQVLEIGYMDEDLLIVTIQMPAAVTVDYEATVEGEKYECAIQDQFTDRLYCFGKKPAGVTNSSFKLYKRESFELFAELSIEIPTEP